MSNQIIPLLVPGVDQTDGPPTLVSTLVGEKTFELSGTYVGQYIILGSHDGSLYVPLLTFNSGAGAQAFKQSTDVIVQFVKVRRKAQNLSAIGISVAGETTTSASFVALAGIPTNTNVGPLPSVDLWSLVPPTGFLGSFSVICGGDFVGTIVIEGSLNGTQFTPFGGFTLSPQEGQGSSRELAPIVIPDVVRYVRLAVAINTKVNGTVSVTLGGDQNSGGSNGGSLFDLTLSYGQGVVGVDDQLPTGENPTFWFGPQTTSDIAVIGQTREWPATSTLQDITLAVYVDLAALSGGGEFPQGDIILTVDGGDTALSVHVNGSMTNTLLTAAASIAVSSGSIVGVRWAPNAEFASGDLRCEIKVVGS